MFDNVALNVVIGLVFIYLLYSLFATVLSEIFATYIGLRARNLKEAVDRMLNDEDDDDNGLLSRLLDTIKLTKNPTNPRIINFYNHPEIKYLGSTGIFKVPSQFKAVSFSKTLLNLLNEAALRKERDGTTKMEDPDKGDIKRIPVEEITKERITTALKSIIEEHDDTSDHEKDRLVLDHETTKYIFSMWKESYGDITKFKLYLEAWFDRTMEQCLEWYKRKIQIILLILGFMLAWFFNADTFSIIHKLSNDKDAREKMVTLAAAYTEKNQQLSTTGGATNLSVEQLDTLLGIKDKLSQDIADANSVLGIGGWPPDSVLVKKDAKANKFIYLPQVDEEVIMDMKKSEITDGKYIYFIGEKWNYFLRLLPLHFFGFLITAIAVSLGAPFWFDLLNKVMKLRTSVKQDTNSTDSNVSGTVSPLNREA